MAGPSAVMIPSWRLPSIADLAGILHEPLLVPAIGYYAASLWNGKRRKQIHETHMRRCLALGRAALAAGETPVGSLIVRGETVLGEGQEGTRALLDPSAHAEVQAVRAACWRLGSIDLSGCTLYSTVEPCVLCAYVIRRAGVSLVVYGVPAGQAGGATSRYDILEDLDLTGWPAPPEIVSGILADECLALLQERAGSVT